MADEETAAANETQETTEPAAEQPEAAEVNDPKIDIDEAARAFAGIIAPELFRRSVVKAAPAKAYPSSDALKWAYDQGRANPVPTLEGHANDNGDLGVPYAAFFKEEDGERSVEIKDMEYYLPRPVRMRRTPQVASVQSFVDYFARYHCQDTVILASISKMEIAAHFDYGGEEPGWNQHSLTLVSIPTTEYKKWKDADGKKFSQESFADFIEDVSHTVIAPSSAALIDIATQLKATSRLTWDRKIDRTTGGFDMKFSNEVQVASSVAVPKELGIRLIPYNHAEPTQMLVRLNIRCEQGNPVFIPIIDRRWFFEEQIFNETISKLDAALADAKIPYPVILTP